MVSFIAGVYLIVSFIWTLIRSWIICNTKRFNLIERYGEGSWALVTGASRGLGLEFCHQLAGEGFNVVMAARSKSLMEKEAEEISTKYKVKAIAISLDASSDTSRKELLRVTEEYDISILVNNAGMMHRSSFANLSFDKISDVFELNLRAPIKFVNAFVEKMKKRKQQSAIIVVSSLTASIPSPFMNLYSSTKAFISEYFGRKKVDAKVDMLISEYGAVSTALLPLPAIPGLISDTVTSVKCTLNLLGKRNVTFGTMAHYVQNWFMQMTVIRAFVGVLGWIATTKFVDNLLRKTTQRET